MQLRAGSKAQQGQTKAGATSAFSLLAAQGRHMTEAVATSSSSSAIETLPDTA